MPCSSILSQIEFLGRTSYSQYHWQVAKNNIKEILPSLAVKAKRLDWEAAAAAAAKSRLWFIRHICNNWPSKLQGKFSLTSLVTIPKLRSYSLKKLTREVDYTSDREKSDYNFYRKKKFLQPIKCLFFHLKRWRTKTELQSQSSWKVEYLYPQPNLLTVIER